MKIDLHMKGWAPTYCRLALKKRPEVIRKWPIILFTPTECPTYCSPCCPLGDWIKDTGTEWGTVDWGETGRVTTWGCTALRIWNASAPNKLSVLRGVACVAVRFPCNEAVVNVFEVAMVMVTLGCVSCDSGCCGACCCVGFVCCVVCCCCAAVCWGCDCCCCGWVADCWICCTGWIWWTTCK